MILLPFKVVSVLDPNLKVKTNLVKFVLKRQLAEYNIMFADSEEGAWLDKVSDLIRRKLICWLRNARGLRILAQAKIQTLSHRA